MDKSNTTKRIGIDARMLGSAPGIGRYIDRLLEELFRLDQENEYILFLREPMMSRYAVPNSRVKKTLAPERWYSIAEQVTLPWRFRRARLDLLFVPQFNVPLFVPCPFVVTIHDVTQLYVPGPRQARSLLKRIFFHLVFGHAVRNAQAVIAVSEYTKREISRHFRVHEKRIEVIYEGAGLPARADDSRPRNLLVYQSPYIFAVGVWRPHKNFAGLLDAFALLRQNPDFSSLKLVLAGEEDPRYPEVRERIRRHGLEDGVVMPGIPSDNYLAQWYRSARAVIVPSLYEGFGLVGLEALAHGVPVVASRTAALPEILGDAALYCDPRDPKDMAEKIARILTDASERERVLEAAPAVLKRYSWESAARKTLGIFRREAA